MKMHLKDSAERRHYIVKRYDTVDTKIQTLYAGEFKASLNKNIPSHSHTFLEIMFVSSGNGQITIDKKIHDVQMGDIVIYYPKQQHVEWSVKPNVMSTLFFSVKPNSQLRLMFKTASPGNVLHVQNEYRDYYSVFTLLVKEAKNENKNYFDKIVNCLAKTIILKILQHSSLIEAKETNETVNRIKDYIDEHYLEDLSLINLYKKLYISEFYGSRLFKQYIGTTPVSYIISKRMREAQNMLGNTNETITSIAYKLGYKDIYYFTKIFKKEVGVSPSAYRKSISNK
ncbi:MAG: AraC family transcriptional regulator [Bacilli bacterium]|nr:AraC family transcriptional regulator [Bacilli bacterium]